MFSPDDVCVPSFSEYDSACDGERFEVVISDIMAGLPESIIQLEAPLENGHLHNCSKIRTELSVDYGQCSSEDINLESGHSSSEEQLRMDSGQSSGEDVPSVTFVSCFRCCGSDSPVWRKGVNGERLCNQCFLKQKRNTLFSLTFDNQAVLRPSSRDDCISEAAGSKLPPLIKANLKLNGKPKKINVAPFERRTRLRDNEKSRRTLSKNVPVKASKSRATIVSSNHVWHKGRYFQLGDVVSTVDYDDEQEYYAQVRGFLTDEFGQKSACLAWLLPLDDAPEDGSFDSEKFIIGPVEDVARPLDCMRFICHSPGWNSFRKRGLLIRPHPFSVASQGALTIPETLEIKDTQGFFGAPYRNYNSDIDTN